MFPKFRKQNDTQPDKQWERTHQSHHTEADRAGVLLRVTVLCEHVSEREAGLLFNEIEPMLDGVESLIVDLGHVGVLTSDGIGMLVRLHKRVGERGGRLAVCALNDELAELFKITRMDRLFLVAPDRPAAERELGG